MRFLFETSKPKYIFIFKFRVYIDRSHTYKPALVSFCDNEAWADSGS